MFKFRGKGIESVDSGFRSARAAAGLTDVHFHDLRHTFASRLVQGGVPLFEVMTMLGHKSLAMVMRYAHLSPDYQDGAIRVLNKVGHNLVIVDQTGVTEVIPPSSNPLIQVEKMVGAGGIEPPTPAV